jgi:hypothetical protein
MIAPGYKHREQQIKFADLTSNHSTARKKKQEQRQNKDHALKCSTSGLMNTNKI